MARNRDWLVVVSFRVTFLGGRAAAFLSGDFANSLSLSAVQNQPVQDPPHRLLPAGNKLNSLFPITYDVVERFYKKVLALNIVL